MKQTPPPLPTFMKPFKSDPKVPPPHLSVKNQGISNQPLSPSSLLKQRKLQLQNAAFVKSQSLSFKLAPSTSCFIHHLCPKSQNSPSSTSGSVSSLGSTTAPQPWPPLRCPSLHALVADGVAAHVDFCNGLVDPKGGSKGLVPSQVIWHTTVAVQETRLHLPWFHSRPPNHVPRCGARALRPSSPNLLPLRLTFVTVQLICKASARACRIGTRHMAKWAADSWAFHCICSVMRCQLAVPHVWHKHTQGTCQDCHSCPVMSDPHSCQHPAHSLLNTFVW